MNINGKSFDIGSVVSFTTRNPQDVRIWQGTVVGFCGYQVAAGYGDLINYYQQVVAGFGSTNRISRLANTEFMLISTENESGNVVQAISPEWIEPTSFRIVAADASYLIQVTTHNNETVSDVLQLLRDNGFTCKSL